MVVIFDFSTILPPYEHIAVLNYALKFQISGGTSYRTQVIYKMQQLMYYTSFQFFNPIHLTD